jgi:CDP-glucose 4,6-dehydratase
MYEGRCVLVTGHTGFKGSWLSEWLLALGARVIGFSRPPEGQPALFNQLDLASRVDHHLGDIRSAGTVRRVVLEAQPDFVFHLAAQSLVRRAHREPVATWQTNVLGTVHLLEALRALEKPCAAVAVTSDKCYENRECPYAYRETDKLGGRDPYSSSKASAELAVAAWRQSYFQNHPVRIASARAGNVIGGGDWSEDRIVPDCIRAVARDRPVRIRSALASRPWQHVLEALSGYLWLAVCLRAPKVVDQTAEALAGPFNFGPGTDASRSVQELVEVLMKHCGGSWTDGSQTCAPHEAGQLQLNTDRAAALLGWHPVWDFERIVLETARWYLDTMRTPKRESFRRCLLEQIETYTANASAAGLLWATAVRPVHGEFFAGPAGYSNICSKE